MKKFILFIVSISFVVLSIMLIDEQIEVFRLKKVTPVFSETLPVVQISSDDTVLELHLYDSAAATAFIKNLPDKLIMTRWGDGGYGASLEKKIEFDENETYNRRAFFKGEVVLRKNKNTIFFMFGPTPVGFVVDYPMLLSSGGIPLGQIKNYSELENLVGVVEFSFKIKK